MTVQQQPAMQLAMTAPQVNYEQTQAVPSMTYSMAPQTMGAAATTFVAEPIATRIEPAGGIVMEQQPVPTRIEAGNTYVQGAQAGTITTYGQGGGVIASGAAGGMTAFGTMQTPVTYAAPGAISTTTAGAFAVGGAGQASLFDQIDTNHDGVISRAEFTQAVQQ